MDFYLVVVYTFHILALAPVMIAVGNFDNDKSPDPSALRYLRIMGWTALIYHGLALTISLLTGSFIWNWSILLRPFLKNS